jgi:hypothetical protein
MKVIRIPDGATVEDVSSFYTSFDVPDDTLTDRLVMNVNGHSVQIIRYDGGENMLVSIDNSAKIMKPAEVDAYIARRIR